MHELEVDVRPATDPGAADFRQNVATLDFLETEPDSFELEGVKFSNEAPEL